MPCAVSLAIVLTALALASGSDGVDAFTTITGEPAAAAADIISRSAGQSNLPISINISCSGGPCLAAPPPPSPPPSPPPAPPPPPPTGLRRNIFVSGEGGYSCFRIPAVLQLPTGGYAVFAEARNKSCSDWAPTDIVVKTSLDGTSWGNMTVLCPFVGEAGQSLCTNHDFDYALSAHNPSPVVVDDSTIVLTMENNCWGCKHTALYSVRGDLQQLQHTGDGGGGGGGGGSAPRIRWAENATDLTKANNWDAGLDVGAAGNGVLLKTGASAGRAVIPVHSEHWGATGEPGSAAMYVEEEATC